MFQKIILFLLVGTSVFSQDSLEINLSEVKVSANISPNEIRKTARNVSIIDQKDIKDAPVKTLDGILQYALNVDVRSRSPFGVQSDISIRGGHFDQTLIMIDGVKMNDPQTGHHAMNLPIPIEQIERIEVLQGGASRVYGPSAFSGVINFITKKSADNSNSAIVNVGQFGLSEFKGNYGLSKAKNQTFLSASKSHSDGYSYNTAFDRLTFYGKTTFLQSKGLINIQGGLVDNKFGASNFYHPKYYDQYEETNTKFLAITNSKNFSNKLRSTLIGSFRRHNDIYDFDKYLKSNINNVNFHQSDVFDIDWKLRYLSDFGASSIGVEWRQEGIISNRLGDNVKEPKTVKAYPEVLYSKSKIRQNLSTYIEQQKQWDSWFISGGALVNFNTQFGANIYPGIDISFFPKPGITIYGTANKSLRFPTFTEMYLNTSTVVADANLLPEKAVNYEIGLKSFKRNFHFTASVFYKKTTDAIDKVKRVELAKPTMENINDINMAGIEFLTQYNVAEKKDNSDYWFQKVQLNYAYLVSDRKEERFQSFYTLNYLKHKLSASSFFRLANGLTASVVYTFKKREGSYQWDNTSPIILYKPVNLVDVRINYNKKWFNLYLDINNALNYQYFDFGFVEQPGRWISGGTKMSF
jgi:vitamin B12 transporter